MAAPDDSLRRALLTLHKAVLAAERAELERIHGELSNAAFLQIVSDPVRYGWLKPFSALILAFEEDEEERAPDDELRRADQGAAAAAEGEDAVRAPLPLAHAAGAGARARARRAREAPPLNLSLR